MQTIKGPGLFIAQFVDADARLGTLEGIAAFAAECGFTALQMPTFYPKIFDLEQAAQSQSYCDDVRGTLSNYGLRISELTSQRQGHLMAVNPAYDLAIISRLKACAAIRLRASNGPSISFALPSPHPVGWISTGM
jgi:sugar phosphate isomerase/epimerase